MAARCAAVAHTKAIACSQRFAAAARIASHLERLDETNPGAELVADFNGVHKALACVIPAALGHGDAALAWARKARRP